MPEGPSWKVTRDPTRPQVIATFRGTLAEADGESSAHAFVEAMGEDRCDVVFDIRHMQRYDSGARRAWQQVLWPRRSQIASLMVVGGNAMVSMGASMLALALGIKASFLDEPPE